MSISANAGFDLFDDSRDNDKRLDTAIADASDFIVDMREWDVPYHVRVLIDKGNFHDCYGFLVDFSKVFGLGNGIQWKPSMGLPLLIVLKRGFNERIRL